MTATKVLMKWKDELSNFQKMLHESFTMNKKQNTIYFILENKNMLKYFYFFLLFKKNSC